MKPGDMVQIKEESYDLWEDYDHLLEAVMLVTSVETTFPGAPEIAMAPVIQVICPDGLKRFNIDDLEVVCEGR